MTSGQNPTPEEAALLQGLHRTVDMFDRDGILSAGEWWWSFLEDFTFYIQHTRNEPFMRMVEKVLTSSMFDMDLAELRNEGVIHEFDSDGNQAGDRKGGGHARKGSAKGTAPSTLRKRTR